MGINFSLMVYEPAFDMFARPITVTPVISQPGAPSYPARGIWHTDMMNVQMEDGSLFGDQTTNMDILEVEFPFMPQQLDQITIIADGDVPAEGTFEITRVWSNGGGETNLILRRIEPSLP